MSNGSELKSAGAQALRAAGYVPLNRLWVTQEEHDLIKWMASKHADEVNEIRTRANREAAQRNKEAACQPTT